MKASISAAIKNIAEFGDTDIFPLPFERHIFYDKPLLVQAALEDLHSNFGSRLATTPPDNITTLAPVGYTGFRWATQIDPIWNAYYLALVIEMAESIESARIPISQETIFSYRYTSSRDDGRLFDDQIGWKAFMQTSARKTKESAYIVICDISDFYPRIYHHRVENALKWLKAKPEIVKRIVELLGAFSNNVSYGIPVGGDASRLLAELVLNTVDKSLRSSGVKFCRFVDDYRIFCDSKEQAYEHLILLSDKLFNEGLSLQKNKTRILASKEFFDESKLLLKAHQIAENEVSEEEKLLRISIHFDPYSETRIEDYEKLKHEVSRVDIVGILMRELEKTRIDAKVIRHVLSALEFVDSKTRSHIIETVLLPENLQTLTPVFSRLMRVLRKLYPIVDEATQDVIDDSLLALIQVGSYLIKLDLNLAYVLQVLRHKSTQDKEVVFSKLFKQSTSPLVRREIILAMTGWGHNHWLTDLKKNFVGLSKWERRVFIVSSYFLTDEGKHWRKSIKSSFDPFEAVVREWFSERFNSNQTLPQ